MARNLFYFAIMSLIWGLTWAAIKLGLEVLPPLLLAAVRYLLAAVILLAFAVEDVGAAFAEGRTLRTFASALLVNTGTYGLLFWGMQSVPSGLSGLVNLALIPVLLFALAALAGEERPTLRHALAIAMGCAGLAGLFWTRLGQGGGSAFGLAAIVTGTACYCIGSVVARPLVGPVKPLALTLVQAALGGAALLGLSLISEAVSATTVMALITPRAIGSLLFLSLMGTVVAYTLYLVLLRCWGTLRAGLYAFVSPIVALAAGAWLFDEQVGPPEIFGVFLLLTAAATALWRHPEPATIATKQREHMRD
jgi:drug/metabolite transporter (DMT)-like permease